MLLYEPRPGKSKVPTGDGGETQTKPNAGRVLYTAAHFKDLKEADGDYDPETLLVNFLGGACGTSWNR